jgi:hypothetical protein
MRIHTGGRTWSRALAGPRGKRGSPALAPQLDRNDGLSLRIASAAPDAPFEIEYLSLRAEPEPPQELRRQQRHVMASGAIHLYEVAAPKILDPRERAVNQVADTQEIHKTVGLENLTVLE